MACGYGKCGCEKCSNTTLYLSGLGQDKCLGRSGVGSYWPGSNVQAFGSYHGLWEDLVGSTAQTAADAVAPQLTSAMKAALPEIVEEAERIARPKILLYGVLGVLAASVLTSAIVISTLKK